MSLGYAEKLSYIEDVGNVGMAEFFDSPQILQEKVSRFSFVLVHFDTWGWFFFSFFFLVKVLFVFMILSFLQLYPSMLLRFLC